MAEESSNAAPQSSSDAGWALSAAGRQAAEAYLKEHTRLARLQADDIVREDSIRHWQLRFTHASTVMKLAFELSLALIFLIVAAIIAGAVWSAHEANGLVIEALQMPPDFAARGLSGQVAASRLLDKISRLQDKTDSIRAPSSYANNWGDDIKVQIPDTGVSIGEFNRYLRQTLGHETHITGEVWREGDGSIAVVARAGADEGTVFKGKESEFDTLLQKAAEDVYGKTQPYRYAAYLLENGRQPESVAILQNLIVNAAPKEQAWALALLSNVKENNGDLLVAVALNDEAIARDPDNALAPENRAEAERELGWDEATLRDFRESLRLASSGRSDINPAKVQAASLVAQSEIARRTGDFAASVGYLKRVEALPDFAGSTATSGLIEMLVLAALHDSAGVERLARAPIPPIPLKLDRLFFQSQAQFIAGDTAEAMRTRNALLAVPIPPVFRRFGAQRIASQLTPLYALSLARKGDFKGADAAIVATPTDCDLCMRIRGRIAALEKQWSRADFWFAAAEKHAPSIPFADTDWGAMLMAKGDLDGAIAKFESAHRNGPHFADPLEMWGEALIAKNHSDLALAKFEEAAKNAPNWGRLHLKWGDALWWSGNKAAAQKEFAIAAGLDLTVSEESELARVSHG